MTFGTWLFTKMRGELVGTDSDGNRYYQDKRMIPGMLRLGPLSTSTGFWDEAGGRRAALGAKGCLRLCLVGLIAAFSRSDARSGRG